VCIIFIDLGKHFLWKVNPFTLTKFYSDMHDYNMILMVLFMISIYSETEFKEVQEITKRRKFELSKYKGLNLYLNLIIILHDI